jgi:hypothetical protein
MGTYSRLVGMGTYSRLVGMGTYSSGNGYLLEVSGLCQRIIAEDTPRLGERHL